MSETETAMLNEEQFKAAVSKLESLLKRQLDLARRGNIDEVESLAVRTGELIRQVSESHYFSQPSFEQQRDSIQQLYGGIALAVSAQMDDISNELGKIQKGRKTITLYRENI